MFVIIGGLFVSIRKFHPAQLILELRLGAKYHCHDGYGAANGHHHHGDKGEASQVLIARYRAGYLYKRQPEGHEKQQDAHRFVGGCKVCLIA